MIRIEESYSLPVPIEAVFALFSDPARDPEWQEMVKEVRRDDSGPIGVGSTYGITFSFMGRRMDFQAVVARCEAPHRYAYRSTDGPFSYAGEVELTQTGAATAVMMRLEIEPRGFFGIVPEAVLIQVFRKQLQRSIAHQERILTAAAAAAA